MRNEGTPVTVTKDRADGDTDDEHPRQHRPEPRAVAIARQRVRVDPRVKPAHRVISMASDRFAQGWILVRERLCHLPLKGGDCTAVGWGFSLRRLMFAAP